jgi:hypothetical protein
MPDTHDRKPRPLIHAVISGAVSGVLRTLLDWLAKLLDLDL